MEESQLVSMIRKGAPHADRAMRVVYESYYGTVVAAARRKGCPESALDDVAQEVLVKFYREVAKNGIRRGAVALLRQIAGNEAITRFRRVGRHEGGPELSDVPEGDLPVQRGVEEDALHGELVDCMLEAFRKFAEANPEPAEVLMRQASEGIRYRELGAWLKKSEGAAREYVSRWRKRLHEFRMRLCPELLAESS